MVARQSDTPPCEMDTEVTVAELMDRIKALEEESAVVHNYLGGSQADRIKTLDAQVRILHAYVGAIAPPMVAKRLDADMLALGIGAQL